MQEFHIDSVYHLPRPIIAIGNRYRTGTSSSLTTIGAASSSPERRVWSCWPRPRAPTSCLRSAACRSRQHRVITCASSARCGCRACTWSQARSPTCRALPGRRDLALHAQLDDRSSQSAVETALDSRAAALMELIRHELQQLPVLPLSLRYPRKSVGRALPRVRPQAGIHETIDDWAADLHMSRRAFTRLFRRETGSASCWRQQPAYQRVPRLRARNIAMDFATLHRLHAHVQASFRQSSSHISYLLRNYPSPGHAAIAASTAPLSSACVAPSLAWMAMPWKTLR